ncbi:MAG: VanZ family protein [Saccharofermentans sp.]|nr:VanZ family protein [Saccharofermentans sp.]
MTTEKFKMTVHEKEISIRYCVLAFIFWVMTLSWIVTIYYMSAQTGAQSSQMSHGFVSALNEIFGLNIQDDSIVRMVAHTAEFALLTFLSYMALSSTNKISNKTSYAESPVKLMRSDNEMNIIFTLWFTILNAIFDEYHQLFVSGRAGTIFNVLIDLIGIVIVLIIIRIAFTIYLKTKGRSEVVYT